MLILGLFTIITVTAIGLYRQSRQHTGQLSNSSDEIESDSIKSNFSVSEDLIQSKIEKIDSISANNESVHESKPIEFEEEKLLLGELIRLKTIIFEEDKSVLNETSHQELDNLVKFLMSNPKVKIEVQGHTDRTRDKQYSINLSLKRAQSVKDYLLSKGVKNEIRVKGYGFSKPLIDSTGAGDSLNRRVEIRITGI